MAHSKLNIESWNRKDHFNFFRQFDDPYFGITAAIDCTKVYLDAKSNNNSFFLSYLHKSLVAANKTEAFRYRIEGDEVLIFEHVHASPTINRPDGTFGFGYIDYHEDFQHFLNTAHKEIEKVRNSTGLIPSVSGENVIHYSSIPWVNFTAISHPMSLSFKSSIPKISFGKMTSLNDRFTIPVSIHVHHALMDGYHVGQYLELFQKLMLS